METISNRVQDALEQAISEWLTAMSREDHISVVIQVYGDALNPEYPAAIVITDDPDRPAQRLTWARRSGRYYRDAAGPQDLFHGAAYGEAYMRNWTRDGGEFTDAGHHRARRPAGPRSPTPGGTPMPLINPRRTGLRQESTPEVQVDQLTWDIANEAAIAALSRAGITSPDELDEFGDEVGGHAQAALALAVLRVPGLLEVLDPREG